MVRIVAALILTLFTSQAFAVWYVKNGGDAVVCMDGVETVLVQALDYYDLRTDKGSSSHGVPLDPKVYRDLTRPGDTLLTVTMSEYERRILAPLNDVPEFWAVYKQVPRSISVARAIPASYLLKGIPDEDVIYNMPAGCTIEQMLVRQGDNLYANENLLFHMDDFEAMRFGTGGVQKAFLNVHEKLMYILKSRGCESPALGRSVIAELMRIDSTKQSVTYALYRNHIIETLPGAGYTDLLPREPCHSR